METIPSMETEWVEHTVDVGETLWSISQKYDTDVETIRKVNELKTNVIQKGQTLKILTRTSALSTTRDKP